MEAKQVLTQFLRYWKRCNKKQMYIRTTKTWQSQYNKNAFDATGLKSFEIISGKVNDVVADFQIKLNDEPHSVRMLKESSDHKTSKTGEWGVFPASFRRII